MAPTNRCDFNPKSQDWSNLMETLTIPNKAGRGGRHAFLASALLLALALVGSLLLPSAAMAEESVAAAPTGVHKPQNLHVTSTATNAVWVDWDEPQKEVSGYQIWVNDRFWYWTPNTSGKVGGLQPGTCYDIHVRSTLLGGNNVSGFVTVVGCTKPIPDPGGSKLIVDDPTITEGAPFVDVRVRLTQASDRLVSVKFATAAQSAQGGQDYYGVYRVVTFDPFETVQTVRITIVDDDVAESVENFKARIWDAQNAEIADNTGYVTIYDND